jgi:hypothetical protein
MHQLYPSVTTAGVWTDLDFIQQDFRGRLPTWTVAAAVKVDRDAETEPELPCLYDSTPDSR